MIVDGGKGQLSAALDVMRNLGLKDVPLAGLAKQNEELFVQDLAEPIVLPRTSQALYLVQRIRDEAHRFAITYHRQVRAQDRHAERARLRPRHRPEAQAGPAAQVRLRQRHPRGVGRGDRLHGRLHGLAGGEGQGVSVTDALKTLLFVPVVLVGLLLASWLEPKPEGPLECATGELATNPTLYGNEVPLLKRFNDVHGAEAFLCIDLPEMQEKRGWRLRYVDARRARSLDPPGANDDYRRLARIEYENPSLNAFVGISPHIPGVFALSGLQCTLRGSPTPYETRTVIIQGQEARLYSDARPTSQPRFAICWERNGLTIFAGGTYQRDLDPVDAILRLLETVH